MAIRWADLREQAWLLLDDAVRADEENPDFNPEWSEAEFLFFLRQALAEVSFHTAPMKIYTVGLETSVEQVIVPDDVLKVGPIMVLSGGSLRTMLRPITLEPGLEFGESAGRAGDQSFYEWPEGTVNFLAPVTGGQSLRLHYWAHWNLPGQDDELVNIPRWLEMPVLWLIQKFAVVKPAFQAARLGQFKTRDDSGRPQDNPLLEYARFCQRQYEMLIEKHPSQDRSGWETT